jgi:hypothetical protein
VPTDIVKLSRQEESFVELYLQNPDLSELAQALSLSLRTVKELLKREEVRKAIGLAMLVEKRDRLEVVRDHLVQELHQLSNYDLKDLFDESGRVRHLAEMPNQMRAAIKGFKMGKYGPEFQFYDTAAIKMHLLSLTMKALGQIPEGKQESTVLEVPAEDQE